MSVQVIDIESCEKIYNKAWSFGFNKVCDINYCHTLSYDNEEHLQQIIKNWVWLNEMTWNRRYKEDDKCILGEFITFKKHKTIDTYQLYKSLQFLDYNIDLDMIKKGCSGMEDAIEIPQDKLDSYNILQKALTELANTIIAKIPEWKDAQWG